MPTLDEPVEVDGKETTLRQLAAEGRLTRCYSSTYAVDGVTRAAWFADIEVRLTGVKGFEISKATFDQLGGMGVPLTRRE